MSNPKNFVGIDTTDIGPQSYFIIEIDVPITKRCILRSRFSDQLKLVSILAVLLCQQCLLVCAAPTKKKPIRWSTIQKARSLETHGRLKESLEVYRSCLNTRAFGMFSYLGMARCYAKMNELNMAEKTLIDARQKYKDHWSQKFILGDLADYYERSGRLKDLQAVRNELLKKMPKRLSTEEKEQFEYYEHDFELTKNYESNTTLELEGRYPWLQFSKLPETPIRLYIGTDNSVPLDPKVYTSEVLTNLRKLAQSAADEWSSATDGRLKFELTDKIEQAQIRLLWTANLKKRGHSWASGEESIVEDKSKNLQYSQVFVFLHEWEPLETVFHATCLHELGHALGLPHSSKTTDIMYHTQNKEPWGKEFYTTPDKQKLSQNDIRNVRQIYADPFIAADFAKLFLRKAMIEQDASKAYALLTDDLRGKVTVDQLRSQIKPGAGVPSAVFQVKTFDRGKKASTFNFGIVGKKSFLPEALFFNVSVRRDNADIFKVETFSRVFSEDQLGPQYPKFDDDRLWVVERPTEPRPQIATKKVEALQPKLNSARKRSMTSKEYANLLAEMIELCANDGRWQESIDYCREVLQVPPFVMPWSKGQTYRIIGYSAFMSQKDKEAEEACKQAVLLLKDRELIQPLRVLGDIYAGSGNLDGALTVYKRLVEITAPHKEVDPPTYCDSLSKLADIYRRRKEFAIAERTYSQGMEFWKAHGEPTVPWLAKSLYGNALVLIELNKAKEAIKPLQEARLVAREVFGAGAALEGAIVRRLKEANKISSRRFDTTPTPVTENTSLQ